MLKIEGEKRRKILWVFLSLLGSTLFLSFALYSFNGAKLGHLKRQLMACEFSVQSIVLIILCSFTVLTLRATRLRSQVEQLTYFQALKVCATHTCLTRLLPFRVGELSMAVLLNRESELNLTEGTLLTVWLRLLEVVCLGPFAIICLVLASYETNLERWLPSSYLLSFVMMIFVAAIILLKLRSISVLILKATLSACNKWRRLRELELKLRPVLHQAEHIESKRSMLAGALTLLILCAQATLFLQIIHLTQAELPWGFVGLGSIVVHLAGVLPAPTIGNLGTHELGWSVIFHYLGLSSTIAILSATISQWLTLLLAVSWALIFSLRSPQSVLFRTKV